MPTAIFTKYLGYTERRASRIKAYAAVDGNAPGRSLTFEYNCAYSAERNHVRAAEALADKLGWHGDWPEPHAHVLTQASKSFGNIDLYIGDDGKIYA